MDLPVKKRENNTVETSEQVSPVDSVVETSIPTPDVASPVPEVSTPEPIVLTPVEEEPIVTEEQNASAILDAEEQELPPVPVSTIPSVVTPIVKTRTKRCPKGCVKKSRCKGGSIKGGKRRKSLKSKRKNKRRKSRKSRKN